MEKDAAISWKCPLKERERNTVAYTSFHTPISNQCFPLAKASWQGQTGNIIYSRARSETESEQVIYPAYYYYQDAHPIFLRIPP